MIIERKIQQSNFVFFGGSTGMGLATAVEIARRAGNVLTVGRSEAAGQAAVTRLLAEGAASAEFLQADVSTLDGMAAAAQGVKAWRAELHGLVHTAMSASVGKQITVDGLEFAFALQYLARAVLNRLLAENLARSGDGRVVLVSGNVPAFFMPPLDDLQFERRKWAHMKSVMGTHLLGHLHIQEASQRWKDLPITLTAICVGPTKTKVMSDPRMPLLMRIMGRFGTTPEASAVNIVRALTVSSAAQIDGSKLPKPKAFVAERIDLDTTLATKLWSITSEIASRRAIALP
ncbi:SDR family NAD(P)-dependent oxidoreductase [Xanthomonas hydrangeae]|uniref:SDR family NAD(P)-dependent oxidoreductase n=1 Tax=Xanthomonas hydrangeae TaxID=2775159 RepID=A0AAU0BDS4_9XANT|nr:SDR family NAD(P)-dependent oxidoreductase [Xanthomonas hydrangeae]WOB50329.1 SDR family NAD(P)-dependent oxidoreductase [Xanthomonas hydrangeae]